MSSIEGARPFVRRVAPPPPPPPPAVDGRPSLASVAIDRHPNVIRVEPSLDELSPIEMFERARPYIALAFALTSALVVVWLVAMLYRRYRAENVAPAACVALDRRSVRRNARSTTTTTNQKSVAPGGPPSVR